MSQETAPQSTAPQDAALQDTAPVPPSGHEPAAASTRERILAIALELFTERGYDKTSIRDIAERLGTTKAALYYHFKSKADILYELHLRLHAINEELLDGLESLPEGAARERALPELFDRFITAVDEHRELVRFQLRNQSALAGLAVADRHEAANADLGQRIQRLLGGSQLSAELSMRVTCAFGAVLTGVIFNRLLGETPHDEQIALVRVTVARLFADVVDSVVPRNEIHQ